MNHTALANMLHDEIDASEAARQRVAEIAERVIRQNMAMAMQSSNSMAQAFELLASLVEDEITDPTTEHFQEIAELAKRRALAAHST